MLRSGEEVGFDASVRATALRALELYGPEQRTRIAGPLTHDPVRAVRIAAARALAPVPQDQLDGALKTSLAASLAELIEAEMANADRPEAHMNLGILYTSLRWADDAERSYRTATRVDPGFWNALVNLADLYRISGRDPEAEAPLRQALEMAPDEAPIHHALGLLMVRQRRLDVAVPALERATELDPENPRFVYVLAVALDSVGRTDRAIDLMLAAHERFPNEPEILAALATFHARTGRGEMAIMFARKLVDLRPQDPGAPRSVPCPA